MKVYMRVTDDEYELPVAIADTQADLARMVGVGTNTVCSALYKVRKWGQRSVYKEVEIDDEMDQNY